MFGLITMSHTVTVQLTREDLAEVASASAGTPVLKLSTSTTAVLVAGAVIGGGGATLINSAFESEALSWSMGGLVGALVAVWFWLRRLEAAVPVPRFPDGPMVIDITAAGVDVTHPHFSSHNAWQVIEDVKSLPHHFVIATAFGTHFVFPARAFPDRRRFEDCIAEARRLLQAGHDAPR